MADINLVSAKLAPSPQIKKLASYIKKFTFIATPVVIVGIVAVLGVSGVNATRLRSLENQKSELTAKIKSLESVEQQYTLVIDRLNKLKGVSQGADAYSDYEVFKDVSANLPEGVNFMEGSISPGSFEVSYEAESSKQLSQIFSDILSNSLYSKVTLRDFSFNSERGYVFTFELSKT